MDVLRKQINSNNQQFDLINIFQARSLPNCINNVILGIEKWKLNLK